VYCTANQEKLAYTKVQYLLVKTSIPYRILLLKRLDALETAIGCYGGCALTAAYIFKTKLDMMLIWYSTPISRLHPPWILVIFQKLPNQTSLYCSLR
jgi:hypothetical protein